LTIGFFVADKVFDDPYGGADRLDLPLSIRCFPKSHVPIEGFNKQSTLADPCESVLHFRKKSWA